METETQAKEQPGRHGPKRASIVLRNIAANFVGKVVTALLSLAFVPLFIRVLGIEAYGLVGFYVILQSLVLILDMGLSMTLNRELARLSSRQDSAQESRDLTRSLEIIYWGAAVILVVASATAAPFVSRYWVTENGLSPDQVGASLRLIGIAISLHLPFALYSGGLLGLQQHVRLNALTASVGVLQWVGSVFVLELVSPTVEAFFVWQFMVNALQTTCAGWLLWRALPHAARPPRFRAALLARVWRFAASLAGNSLLGAVVSYLDKIAVIWLLPLATFGYYSLAASVASGLSLFILPIYAAIFPRFTELVAHGDREGVAHLYHASSQLAAVTLLPAMAVLCLFSHEAILAWTGDQTAADRAAGLASLLVAGTAINALLHIPLALQLAHGWTRLVLYQNAFAAALVVPALILAVRSYGALGAARVWLALNLVSIVAGVPMMHARLLPSEMRRWYCVDIGAPLLGTLVCVVPLRWTVPFGLRRAESLGTLVAVGCLAVASAVLAAPILRAHLVAIIRSRRSTDGSF